tara:strand:- start:5851 stop:6162 length:312 start_codon:yes stop_codon:yes gene_type:complete
MDNIKRAARGIKNMAGRTTKNFYQFKGENGTFVEDELYSVRDISDKTGIGTHVFRKRLQHRLFFNESHLCAPRPLRAHAKAEDIPDHIDSLSLVWLGRKLVAA